MMLKKLLGLVGVGVAEKKVERVEETFSAESVRTMLRALRNRGENVRGVVSRYSHIEAVRVRKTTVYQLVELLLRNAHADNDFGTFQHVYNHALGHGFFRTEEDFNSKVELISKKFFAHLVEVNFQKHVEVFQ